MRRGLEKAPLAHVIFALGLALTNARTKIVFRPTINSNQCYYYLFLAIQFLSYLRSQKAHF